MSMWTLKGLSPAGPEAQFRSAISAGYNDLRGTWRSF